MFQVKRLKNTPKCSVFTDDRFLSDDRWYGLGSKETFLGDVFQLLQGTKGRKVQSLVIIPVSNSPDKMVKIQVDWSLSQV